MTKRTFVPLILLLVSALGLHAAELKLATVNMQELYDSYYKVQEGTARLQSVAQGIEEQLRTMQEEGQAMVEEFQASQENLQNPALSDSAKQQLQTELQGKAATIRQKEQEVQQFINQRQRELQQRNLQFRERMIKEIHGVVKSIAEKQGATLVLDTADLGTGTPTVIFAHADFDITAAVKTELNKDAPKE